MQRALIVAIAALALGCNESVDGGSCAEDSECGVDKTCLYDFDRATTYCTDFCVDDSDCPVFQDCRTGKRDSMITEAEPLQYCVDRIRGCGEVEFCNGFDDDCDGVIDEAGCQIITGCLDDRACDGWVCQAPENQPVALCAPPNESATKADFDRCTQDSDCRNNICDTGFCTPLCRPGSACSSFIDEGVRKEAFCVGAVGGPARPKHNECQIVCNSPRDCNQGQSCVWREVYQAEPLHSFVCSFVDETLLPLGSPCPDNEPDGGDAMCQSGLCFGQICTRPCGGPGSSCADVGANLDCITKELTYGALRFGGFLCVDPN